MILNKIQFIIITFFLFNCLSWTFAQQVKYVKIISTENNQLFHKYFSHFNNSQGDSVKVTRELNNVLQKLHALSYITASIDSINSSPDTIHYFVYIGKKFPFSKLKIENVERIAFVKNFNSKFLKKDLSLKEFVRLEQEILAMAEDRGYPFATVRLDSISISDKSIHASLQFSPGPIIVLDSINIEGDLKVKHKSLLKQINLKEGEPFSQQKFENINDNLKEWTFLTVQQDPQLYFTEDKANITLFLKEKKVNQINGIIGFMPNPITNKLLLTGELNLDLRNLFYSGKTLQLEWKRFNRESQLLNFAYLHPNLLGPLNAKIDFSIFRQDTSFINLYRGITLSQNIRKGKLLFSLGYKTTNSLSPVIENINPGQANRLSAVNFNLLSYGMGYEWNNLDNLLNPKKGFFLQFHAFMGNKRIQGGNLHYSKIKTSSVQLAIDFNSEKYFKLSERSIVLTRFNAGKIYNSYGQLFLNDLYRLGGLKNFRGFNENYFYVSTYTIGTIEYRYYLESTTSVFGFSDFGYLERKLYSNGLRADTPVGIGVGISLQTGPGVFNLVYSLGKSEDQKMSFSHARIHFGFVSRF